MRGAFLSSSFEPGEADARCALYASIAASISMSAVPFALITSRRRCSLGANRQSRSRGIPEAVSLRVGMLALLPVVFRSSFAFFVMLVLSRG